MRCASCGSDIPDDSRFCLRCGKETASSPTSVPVAHPPVDDSHETFALMCMAFAFMMFFFSLAPFFMGIWVTGAAMLGVGVVLMFAGYRMIRVSKKERIEMLQIQGTKVKVKCRYCGSLNDETAQRCHSCGAGL